MPTCKTFFQHLREQAISVVIITAVVIVLQLQGCFARFEHPALDTWLHLWLQPRQASHTIVVDITENDYEHLFQTTSPLDPHQLREIIHAMALGRPAVIGVDVDTSTRALHKAYQDLLPAAEGSPVIWAHAARALPKDLFTPARVLGSDTFNPQVHSGLALLPQDPDGIIRRYRRTFRATAFYGSREPVLYMDAFPWAIVKVYCQNNPCNISKDLHTDLILNFLGDYHDIRRIAATHVLELAKGEGWKHHGPLLGKIALLGGTFQAARDEYITPFGPMAGVELVAQVIEAELANRGIRTVNKLLMIAMDLLIAFLMVALYYTFLPRTAFLLSMLALPTLALLGSFVAFSAFGYWANYVPLLVALWIHQLYHDNQLYREMKQRH